MNYITGIVASANLPGRILSGNKCSCGLVQMISFVRVNVLLVDFFPPNQSAAVGGTCSTIIPLITLLFMAGRHVMNLSRQGAFRLFSLPSVRINS